MVLSVEQRDAWQRDGFLRLPGFVAGAECDRLRTRVGELLAALDPAEAGSVFRTDDHSHGRDAWFLESGDKIRFFYEPDAFDGEGRLRQARELSINKLGHALHDLDAVFDRFSRTPALDQLAHGLGLERPLLLQSMYIFKQPRIGGEVHCHQDSTFLHTEPESCVGFWFALEDATLENGALWAEPGGHRRPLKYRFIRHGSGTRLVEVDPQPLPVDGLVPLEAAKGTLIVLHGRLPHRSGPNQSDRSRHAFTLHLIDGTCRYGSENWLHRPPNMPLRGFH